MSEQQHKGRPVYGVHYECSCGWTSATWYGKGAQRNAAAELADHKRKAELEEAE